jgi:FkbM family methyltransferase
MMNTKSMRRIVRYHPVTESVVRLIKKGPTLNLPGIDLITEANPGDIIIDCGANVGDLSTLFVRTGAMVHAFEPNPQCYRILSRRFSLTPNIKCHPFGVMDRESSFMLSTPKAHDQYDGLDVTVGSSFVVFHEARESDDVEVKCIDLAAFIKQLDSRIKLLKIDIEGAEIEVSNHLLDLGLEDRIDLMLVETHERLSADLAVATEKLRKRIDAAGLTERIRLDWL